MSTRAFFRPLGLALLGTLTAAACTSNVGSDESFQRDSFASPTEHGELVFTENARNEAKFTDQTRYHSWTFTLSGDAEVVLQTDPGTVNLDTVMYLYKRKPGEELWGSYVAKNDNHGDEMYSYINKGLTAGEYRVKVKATHPRMVGGFNVDASCTGDGCPVEESGVCEPTHGASQYTEGCGQRISDIMMEPVTSESHSTITWGDHCNHPNLIAQGATAYRDYYGEWFDWDDYVGEDGDMFVMVRKHGDAGAVVSIDLGGDEDNVSFLFDADGKLLVTFHSEQSSSTWYTCGAAGEQQVTEPDTEECGQALLYGLAHDSSDESSGTTTADGAETDLGAFVAAGIRYYAQQKSLAGSAAIDYSLATWEEGAQLTIGSDKLLLADRWGNTLLAMREWNGATEVMCESLD